MQRKEAYIWGADAGQPNKFGKDVDIEEVDGVVEDPRPGFRRGSQNRLSRSSTAEKHIPGVYCKIQNLLQCPI